MATIATTLVESKAMEKVWEAAQQTISVTPPSPPSLLEELFTPDKKLEPPKDKNSTRRKKMTSSLSDSDNEGTWSCHLSVKSQDGSYTSSNEKKCNAPSLPVIHQVSAVF